MIEVDGVSKFFGNVVAVSDVTTSSPSATPVSTSAFPSDDLPSVTILNCTVPSAATT